MERTNQMLEAQLRSKRRKDILILVSACILLLASIAVSCFAGVANVTPARLLATLVPGLSPNTDPLSNTELMVLSRLRLPRIIMAMLAGMGLAVSGLTMQAITGNSMASTRAAGVMFPVSRHVIV